MATHSSALAWRIPGTGEPDGLPSMGSHRVGHDWSDLAAIKGHNKLCEWNKQKKSFRLKQKNLPICLEFNNHFNKQFFSIKGVKKCGEMCYILATKLLHKKRMTFYNYKCVNLLERNNNYKYAHLIIELQNTWSKKWQNWRKK